jgi:hypothetical protein
LKTWSLLEDIDAGVTDVRSGGIRRTALPALRLRAQVDQAHAHRPQSDGTLAWRRPISDARRRAGSRYLGRQKRSRVRRSARRPGRTLRQDPGRRTKPAMATRPIATTSGSNSAADRASSTRSWSASEVSETSHRQGSSLGEADRQVARGRHSHRHGLPVTKPAAAVRQRRRPRNPAMPSLW